MVLAIHAAGSLAFRDLSWFEDHPRGSRWVIIVGVGFTLAIIVESVALYVGRWSYGTEMPLLPVLGVAIPPIAQMVVLAPIVFAAVSRMQRYSLRRFG